MGGKKAGNATQSSLLFEWPCLMCAPHSEPEKPFTLTKLTQCNYTLLWCFLKQTAPKPHLIFLAFVFFWPFYSLFPLIGCRSHLSLSSLMNFKIQDICHIPSTRATCSETYPKKTCQADVVPYYQKWCNRNSCIWAIRKGLMCNVWALPPAHHLLKHGTALAR